MDYAGYKDKLIREFKSFEQNDAVFKRYLNNVKSGRNVWLNANRAVERAGEKVSMMLRSIADSCPYDILRELTAEEYRFLFNYSANIGAMAQEITNQAADIYMNVRFPKIDDSRIDGLLEILMNDNDSNILLSTSQVFNDGVGSNIAQDGVNELINFNSWIQEQAGFGTFMRRMTDGSCCKWCTSMADGQWHKRGEEPADFWRFHKDCTCWIDYKVDKRIDVVSFLNRNGKMTKA